MNKFSFLLFSLLLITGHLLAQEGRPSCGYEAHLSHLTTQMPELIKERKVIDQTASEWLSSQNDKAAATSITIPVVVHVLYRTAAQNISDEQIKSQIKVLNQDFNRLNADQLKTPGPFLSVAANCEISFCLAERDPDGMPTNGITRTQTSVSNIGTLGGTEYFQTALGGHDIWDPDSYLNIWVCEMANLVLGFATPPSSGTLKDRDGLVIGFQYFGTVGNLEKPTDKGRTATHEIGHWLGLQHPWGNGDPEGNNCSNDDGIDDTPNQEKANYFCPSFPSISCSGSPNGDMFMNFMDYVDDRCMNLFTVDQKARMQSILNTNPRQNLLNSTAGCSYTSINENVINTTQYSIHPIPSSGNIYITSEVPTSEPLLISIFNVVGVQVYEQQLTDYQPSHELQLPLENGVYFVILENGEKRVQKKLIIKK